MQKSRMEAFTDGVLAIVITIMVLEIKVPHEASADALFELWPKFLSYALSFLYVGIYWNNHHHTMQAVKSVNSAVLWANMHLLFWLTLLPFSTAWMSESHIARLPTLLYGANLLLCAISYYIWAHSLVAHHGADSALAKAFGADLKGKLSILLYVLGMGLTFASDWLGFTVYFIVALMWLIPDRRMYRAM